MLASGRVILLLPGDARPTMGGMMAEGETVDCACGASYKFGAAHSCIAYLRSLIDGLKADLDASQIMQHGYIVEREPTCGTGRS